MPYNSKTTAIHFLGKGIVFIGAQSSSSLSLFYAKNLT